MGKPSAQIPFSRETPALAASAGVTVIIPAFNYAAYLPQAIKSALRQTYSSLEIIIVDDGSTDDTAAVAEGFRNMDRRVRYLYQKNSGLSAARNTGIAASQTQLVAFLDADDEWEPNFLQRCLATLERLPDEFALISCGSSLIDTEGRVRERKKERTVSEPREVSRPEIIVKTRFSADAVVVRRAAFDRCGMFDETLRSSEDRDMWIRIAAHYRLYHLPEPLVRVRRHDRNMSKHSDRMRDNMRKVLLKAYRQEVAVPFPGLFWLRVASFFCFQTSWMFHDEGRQSTAIRDMTLSLLLWPFFFRPRTLDEPPFFRLRGLARFLLRPSSCTACDEK